MRKRTRSIVLCQSLFSVALFAGPRQSWRPFAPHRCIGGCLSQGGGMLEGKKTPAPGEAEQYFFCSEPRLTCFSFFLPYPSLCCYLSKLFWFSLFVFSFVASFFVLSFAFVRFHSCFCFFFHVVFTFVFFSFFLSFSVYFLLCTRSM